MGLTQIEWNNKGRGNGGNFHGTDRRIYEGRHPAVEAQWKAWQRESILQRVDLAMRLNPEEQAILDSLQPRVHAEPAADRVPQMEDVLSISDDHETPKPKRRRRRRKFLDNRSAMRKAIEKRQDDDALFT